MLLFLKDLLFRLFQGLCHLVGTGCAAAMAVDAFEATNRIVNTHSLQQRAHSLAVAVASTHDLDSLDYAVVDIHYHQF